MQAGVRLALLTWNVEFFHAKIGKVLHATSPEQIVINGILESQADVCLLQETHSGWNKLFDADAKLTQRYQHRRDTGDVFNVGGFTVLARTAITDVRFVEPGQNVRGSLFPAMYFVCGGVRFINVHLRPPVNDDGTAGPTTMSVTSPVRKAELEFVLNALRGDMPLADWLDAGPLIIAGDFNENDGHSAVEHLRTTLGMNDALMLTGQHTHWWPLWSIPFTDTKMILRKRIDHVVFNSHLVADSCEVLQGYEGNASDHLPVCVSLHLRAADEPVQKITTAPPFNFNTLEPGKLSLQQHK